MVRTAELVRGAIRFLAIVDAALVFATCTRHTERMTPINVDPARTPVDDQTDDGLTDTVWYAKAGTSMCS